MADGSGASLADVVAVLERLYPPSSAQSWDRVGLVSGDPEQRVTSILLAVDPTLGVLEEARVLGADLIVTHHPLLLRGLHAAPADEAKGRTLRTLITRNTALYCAHTNADVAQGGVGDALATACGLGATEALTIAEGQQLGRVGDLPEAVSLRDLASSLARRLPSAPAGVRVAGPPEALVRRVAVMGGAGDHAFAEVRASGADVYVTADLRHHPALEAREEAALTEGRPYLIDAGHYASEWLWLPVLARRLGEELSTLGRRLDLTISAVRTDPWDFVVSSGRSEDDVRPSPIPRGTP
jgi:dinuclear metal center YbgI/SA1388 family protein